MVKGGITRRVHLSAKDKLEIVEYSKKHSQRLASVEYSVSQSMVSRWMNQEQQLLEASKKNNSTVHSGRKSSFPEMDESVSQWIIDQRQMELAVTNMDIISKCRTISRDFRVLSDGAQKQYVERLKERSGLTIRRITHVGQKEFTQVEAEALDFQHSFEARVSALGYDNSSIFNMDETAWYYEPSLKSTVEVKGVKNVPIKTSGKESARCTVAFCIGADGSKLPPFIIFKAAYKKTVWREIVQENFSSGSVCTTQANGWMDETAMLDYVERVWKPYITSRRLKRTLLILDSFSAHMVSSVTDAFMELGTEIEFIPGGCTSSVQPVDNGINKPVKDRQRSKYQEYKLGQSDSNEGQSAAPTRKLVASWIKDSWEELSEDTCRAAWKTRVPYFWTKQSE